MAARTSPGAAILRYSRRFFFTAGAILSAFALTSIIVLATGIGRATLHVGQVAPDTLRAPRSIVYRSDIKTSEARDLQASKVQDVYLDKAEACLSHRLRR
jgi:membrane-associated HD superfamily phosphohydrolase